MSKSYISVELRELVREQAKHRCGYCLTDELNSGMKMTIEHIYPESLGGLAEENNLWLACIDCNTIKNDRIQAIDPFTKELVLLFNPRTQKWSEHFEWIQGGRRMVGKTSVGRATVITLDLNRKELVGARQRWIKMGYHPPEDE